MSEIPEWLKSNPKWFDWFEKLRTLCLSDGEKQRLLGSTLLNLKPNEELFTIRSLAESLNCSAKSVIDFTEFLHSNKLIQKETVGKGRVSKTKITVL